MISITAQNTVRVQRRPVNSADACPTCAHPYEGTQDIVVDVDGRTILRDKILAKLTQLEMDIFYAIYRYRPSTISKDRILVQLSSNADTEASEDSMLMTMSRLKKKLVPLRIRIDNLWGEGWRCVLA